MDDLRELEVTYPELTQVIKGIYKDNIPILPSQIIKGQNHERISNIYHQLFTLKEVEDITVEMLGFDEENDLSHFINLHLPEKDNKKFEIEIFISEIAPYAAISVFVDKKENYSEIESHGTYKEINIKRELEHNKPLKRLYSKTKEILEQNQVETLPWRVLDRQITGAKLLICSEERSDVFDLIFGEPAIFW